MISERAAASSSIPEPSSAGRLPHAEVDPETRLCAGGHGSKTGSLGSKGLERPIVPGALL